MIGPLHLGQVATHMGYSQLCICCCPDDKAAEETGGKQFENSVPVTSEPNPFLNVQAPQYAELTQTLDTINEVVQDSSESSSHPIIEIAQKGTRYALPRRERSTVVMQRLIIELGYFKRREQQAFLMILIAAAEDDDDCCPC